MYSPPNASANLSKSPDLCPRFNKHLYRTEMTLSRCESERRCTTLSHKHNTQLTICPRTLIALIRELQLTSVTTTARRKPSARRCTATSIPYLILVVDVRPRFNQRGNYVGVTLHRRYTERGVRGLRLWMSPRLPKQRDDTGNTSPYILNSCDAKNLTPL
jgi:hypothetical protein